MRLQFRRGMSLFEMLAVITLLAVVAGIVVSRNGRTLIPNFGAQGDARRVGLALLQARRRTIGSGTTHAVKFALSGGSIASYSIVSVASDGTTTVVDGPTTFTTDLVVTSSHTQMTYDFEGKAAAAYWVQMVGPNRTWRIDVTPLTGALTTALQ